MPRPIVAFMYEPPRTPLDPPPPPLSSRSRSATPRRRASGPLRAGETEQRAVRRGESADAVPAPGIGTAPDAASVSGAGAEPDCGIVSEAGNLTEAAGGPGGPAGAAADTGRAGRAIHRWPTETEAPRRRWGMPLRAAVLALILAAGFVLGRSLLADPGAREVASVELSADAVPEPGRPDATGQAEAPGTAAASAAGTAAAGPAPGAAAAPNSGERGDAGPNRKDGAIVEGYVVHVAGAVAHPGVVRVPTGARAADAVAAAGGLTADAHPAGVNLAAPLHDGMMLLVPTKDQPPGSPAQPAPAAGTQPADSGSPEAAPGGAAGEPVNLNTADAARLQDLPRVGPVLAERILQWRTEHGGFASVEDLDAVPGIGEAMMAALRPLVTV